ncbi:nucleoside/nucleotide kinase family protein [Ruania zhangjianzhongii]|uniref:nucleoside/nucleotide kinase family protein n=1 Tax=Ruania zhangjianzhongii TaxID=2603206 RepID=UPI0031455CAB
MATPSSEDGAAVADGAVHGAASGDDAAVAHGGAHGGAHGAASGDDAAMTAPDAIPAIRLPDTLRQRADALARAPQRTILGLTGPPGAGKSTLAEALIRYLNQDGEVAVLVPMDGFHLADVELTRLGRADRKGAIDTFDGHGYLALLRRIRLEQQHVVYAPGFERTLEQPISGTIPVLAQHRLVITEGNYLLAGTGPWQELPAELAEVWYCQTPPELRRRRLLARHIRFGKNPAAAAQWIRDVDEANAQLVEGTRERADLVVREDDGFEPA